MIVLLNDNEMSIAKNVGGMARYLNRLRTDPKYSRSKVEDVYKRQMQGNPLTDFLGPDVFKADVTNIPGMDDLHQPQGIIKKSQKMAALTFGAKCTYFLVNGSS